MNDETEYVKLLDSLGTAMDGHHPDNLIPAMVSILCMISSASGVEKRTILSYVADSLDKAYEAFERRKQ
jgi:hypothetical protein